MTITRLDSTLIIFNYDGTTFSEESANQILKTTEIVDCYPTTGLFKRLGWPIINLGMGWIYKIQTAEKTIIEFNSEHNYQADSNKIKDFESATAELKHLIIDSYQKAAGLFDDGKIEFGHLNGFPIVSQELIDNAHLSLIEHLRNVL